MSVEHLTQENRFVYRSADDRIAGELNYQRRPGVIDAYHTEVDRALRGGGIAAELVQALVDFAAAEQARIIPTCPYIRWKLSGSE